jgi:hypothetical protein
MALTAVDDGFTRLSQREKMEFDPPAFSHESV